MNTEPKISVITACYNHGEFVIEMIESVLRQTFEDYEIIIVNDGSTDNTAEILNSINNKKVKIIHTRNHGPAQARNNAINYARAPIIMNLDADDKIASDLLERAYKIISMNSNIGIVYCDAECFGAKTGKFEIGEYSLEAMLYDNRINSLSFFRKEDWLKVGGYSNNLIWGLEDWDFWLLIIEMGREVVKIPEKLVFYRTYKDLKESRSGRRKNDRLKLMESQIKIFRRHEKLYSSYPKVYEHFSKIERKFCNENFLLRLLETWKYNYMKRYYYK